MKVYFREGFDTVGIPGFITEVTGNNGGLEDLDEVQRRGIITVPERRDVETVFDDGGVEVWRGV